MVPGAAGPFSEHLRIVATLLLLSMLLLPN